MLRGPQPLIEARTQQGFARIAERDQRTGQKTPAGLQVDQPGSKPDGRGDTNSPARAGRDGQPSRRPDRRCLLMQRRKSQPQPGNADIGKQDQKKAKKVPADCAGVSSIHAPPDGPVYSTRPAAIIAPLDPRRKR